MINYDKLLSKVDIKALEPVIGKSAVKTIRSGKAIRMKTLEKICIYLGCDIGEIISFKGI